MGKPVRRTQSNLIFLSLLAKAKGNEERPNQTRHCAKLSACGKKNGICKTRLNNAKFLVDKFFLLMPRLKGIEDAASEGLVSDGNDIIFSSNGILEKKNGTLRLSEALIKLCGNFFSNEDIVYRNKYIYIIGNCGHKNAQAGSSALRPSRSKTIHNLHAQINEQLERNVGGVARKEKDEGVRGELN